MSFLPAFLHMNNTSAAIWNIIGWIFAFLFLFTGIWFLSIDTLIGACYLAPAIVLLPPLKKFLGKKLRIALILIFLGIILPKTPVT